MALVNQVKKLSRMTIWDNVKFQIVTHCYLQKIVLSEADYICLTTLAFRGEQELTTFCNEAAEEKIFGSPQTVRNAVGRYEVQNLILKEGKSKKKIMIHPDLQIQSSGNVLLDFKFATIETEKE